MLLFLEFLWDVCFIEKQRRLFTFSPVPTMTKGHVGFVVGHTVMADKDSKFISQSAPCSPRSFGAGKTKKTKKQKTEFDGIRPDHLMNSE